MLRQDHRSWRRFLWLAKSLRCAGWAVVQICLDRNVKYTPEPSLGKILALVFKQELRECH